MKKDEWNTLEVGDTIQCTLVGDVYDRHHYTKNAILTVLDIRENDNGGRLIYTEQVQPHVCDHDAGRGRDAGPYTDKCGGWVSCENFAFVAKPQPITTEEMQQAASLPDVASFEQFFKNG